MTRLVSLKKELSKYHRSKAYLERYYINKRLNDSLTAYYDDLKFSLRYLDNRKPENVLKKL